MIVYPCYPPPSLTNCIILVNTDTVCDVDWAYGLSSGMLGSMSSLDNDAFTDAFMVAHEIGHSVGSGTEQTVQ